MDFQYRYDYDDMSDKEIIGMIITPPHNEEAARYLVDIRYAPLLKKVYFRLTNDGFWYDDCVEELIMHLRGEESNWKRLASFQWRSTFGCWFSRTAWNNFKETYKKLIDNGGLNTSLDKEDPDKPPIQIAAESEEEENRRYTKVLIMEGIRMLKDEDQKFVILKRLKGYNSKEIAILLQKRWEKYGIMKFNNKKEQVIPDDGYVNVRIQRAKDNLKIIIPKIK